MIIYSIYTRDSFNLCTNKSPTQSQLIIILILLEIKKKQFSYEAAGLLNQPANLSDWLFTFFFQWELPTDETESKCAFTVLSAVLILYMSH